MLVGRSVGPPRWRSLDKNYSMVGHDIFLSDIMSLAPRRIKTTDLGGPVEATPEGCSFDVKCVDSYWLECH